MTENISRLNEIAKNMRLTALKMALGAGHNGAHLGPAFSCIEILATLYCSIIKHDANNPNWPDRDRVLISKAHCVLAYYTALHEAGYISMDELMTFEKPGSNLAGHPSMDINRGFEYSGGSLGMALSVGIGMAIDAITAGRRHKIYVLLGDGECNEGSIWEAFLAAPNFKLNNLVVIVDMNKLQYDGTTEEIMDLGNMKDKLRAFGWIATEVNGHDIGALLDAFSLVCDKPHIILADTVKGKGVSFMENVREWHHSTLSQAQYDIATAEILEGGNVCKN